MRIKAVLKVFAVMGATACAVALPAAAYVGGAWVTYTTGNSGLPSNDVRSICFDGSGRLWFGTANGLTRFNGTSWKTFTTMDSLAHNSVNAVAYELSNYGQEIWAGTDGGVSVVSVDGTTCATPYTTTNSNYPGMISNKITSVAVDSQHVRWFGSDLGLMSFGTNGWKSYTNDSTGVTLADNHINSIAYEETNSGPVIWLGTNNGISAINTRIGSMSYSTPYRTTNQPGIVSDMVFAAAMDTSRDTRWFGTDKGLIQLKDSTFTSYSLSDTNAVYADFLPADSIIAVGAGPQMAYFATSSLGVGRFDGVTGASPLDEWSYLASLTVRAIAIGKTGVVWFATDAGVTRWIPPEIDSTSVNEPSAHPIPVALKNPSPNPFNPSTTIEFTLERPGYAVLSIYSAAGQRVRDLTSEALPAGTRSVVWDGKDRNGMTMSSGTYFAQLRFENIVIHRKMLLLK